VPSSAARSATLPLACPPGERGEREMERGREREREGPRQHGDRDRERTIERENQREKADTLRHSCMRSVS